MQFLSRRGVLVGLAAACSLWPGLALADQGDGNDQGDDGSDTPRGRPFTGIPFGQTQQSGGQRLRLIPVNQVNGGSGGDFPASNPGSDALRNGVIVWTGNSDNNTNNKPS